MCTQLDDVLHASTGTNIGAIHAPILVPVHYSACIAYAFHMP